MTNLVEQAPQRFTGFAGRAMLAMLACVAAATVHAGEQAPPQRHFIVFDSIRNQGKPNLQAFGLVKLAPVFGPNWAKPGVGADKLDEAAVTRNVEKNVRSDNTAVFFLDIENLPLLGVPESRVDAHVARLVRVAQLARTSRPEARFGFYGVLPVRVFAPIVERDLPALTRWRDANRRADPIARYVDFIFPSLYTLDDDPKHWEAFAKAMLAEARRYGRPVYPFIWPKHHDGNPRLRGQWLPAAFWRQQLEFCLQHADGVVIWGSAHDAWDADAPWWAETRDFLDRHHSSGP